MVIPGPVKCWEFKHELLWCSDEETSKAGMGVCGGILLGVSWSLFLVTLPFSLLVCFKVTSPTPPSPPSASASSPTPPLTSPPLQWLGFNQSWDLAPQKKKSYLYWLLINDLPWWVNSLFLELLELLHYLFTRLKSELAFKISHSLRSSDQLFLSGPTVIQQTFSTSNWCLGHPVEIIDIILSWLATVIWQASRDNFKLSGFTDQTPDLSQSICRSTTWTKAKPCPDHNY